MSLITALMFLIVMASVLINTHSIINLANAIKILRLRIEELENNK